MESIEDLKKRIKELENANKVKQALKVGPKGGLCVYVSNQRFPITLAKNQWIELLNRKEEILDFMEKNNVISKDQ